MLKKIKNTLRPYKIRSNMFLAYFIRGINKKIEINYRCDKNTKRCFYNIKSPNYKYELFGDNTPVCCATHLYDILKDVTYILEKNNLEYFISFGTLLGAVRHKGLIPWDTDTDIVIPYSEKDKYIKILKKKLPEYDIRETKERGVSGSIIRVNLSKMNSLHVDLFTYLSKDDKLSFGYSREFDKKDIYPLQKISFYDLKLFAPKEIEKQLVLFYGNDYMDYAYKQWALNKTKFKITDLSSATIEKK